MQTRMNKKKIEISVVIPVHNEERNVEILHKELLTVLKKLKRSYEIIFIDDGSTDNTFSSLRALPGLTLIRFRRNFGQTAALSAGFEHAQGKIILALDGDLQSDPRDIPKLLKKVDGGFDVVSGWRFQRKDSLVKKIPSRVANWLISKISGVALHDYGCTMKAYKSDVVKNLDLYGEMHRFIPVLVSWRGAKIIEIKVNHRKRKFGVSKYGLLRTPKVILDIITVKFFLSYFSRPMQIFGGIGFFLTSIGFSTTFVLTIKKVVYGISLFNRPLFLLGLVLIIVGIQFIGIGVVAETMMRIYFNTKKEKQYIISEIID